MPKKEVNRHLKLRKSWIWNNSVNEYVKKWIRNTDKVLNVPNGKSRIGTVLADIDPQFKDVDKVDMKKLPYKNNSFDVVIQDPPWKIGYFNRFKPFYECVRVCKVNGLIIYNAYWIPYTKFPDLLKIEDVVIRQDKPFTNTSIITVFRKLKELGYE